MRFWNGRGIAIPLYISIDSWKTIITDSLRDFKAKAERKE